MDVINKILTVLVVFVAINSVNAQDVKIFIPEIQKIVFYPNNIAETENSLVFLNAQNFYMSIPGAFTSFSGGVQYWIKRYNSGVSGYLLNNKEADGAISDLSGHLAYSTKFDISRTSWICGGILMGLKKTNVSAELLPYWQGGNSLTYDFGANFSYFNKSHLFSVLLKHPQNLIGLNQKADKIPAVELNYSYLYNMSYTNQVRYIRPSLQFELSTDLIYYAQYGTVLCLSPVCFYSYLSGGGQRFINNLILGFGYEFSNYKFVYDYTANLSNLSSVSGKNGVHEVTFLINLQYKVKRGKNRAIKCPDI